MLSDNSRLAEDPAAAETAVVAGPPAASPPLAVALMLVGLSIAGPFIFVADGTPSLLLGITGITVAIAGMITMAAAVRAQIRRRADASPRRRVGIGAGGITLYPTLKATEDMHFPWQHITDVQVAPAAFIIHAGPGAPKPGRHAIRFGKLVTPRFDIISVLDKFRPNPGSQHGS